MTLEELFNVVFQEEQEQPKQEVKKEDVKEQTKQDFEDLQNALIKLLTEIFVGSDEDDTDTTEDRKEKQSEPAQEQYKFDDILEQNIDVLQRLKNCDNNTYAKENVVASPTQPVLMYSKYGHWIIKYLYDTKGTVDKADYEYLRKFCDFVMAQ